jgi:hypothetical protein
MRRIFFFFLASGRAMSIATNLDYIHRKLNSGATAIVSAV